MIRKANLEDFDAILDLSEEFWKETQFDEPFERSHTINMVELAYNNELLAVLEVENKIVGFAAGVKAPSLGSSKAVVGTELAWWVLPDYRKGGSGIKLLEFMEKLAKEGGVKYWNMVSMQSSMPDKVNSMYKRKGYKLSEMTFTKVI